MGMKVNRIGNIAPGGDKTLGKADNAYTEGFFDAWSPKTKINNAVEEISEIILDIAPARAEILTGKDLVINTTMYQAKLPKNLPSEWYGSNHPGDVINDYVTVPAVHLTIPSPSTTFRCGKKLKPETYGKLRLKKNNAVVSEFDMFNGVGNNGVIFLTALDIYNIIWSKANGYAVVSFDYEGLVTYSMLHTEAGETGVIDIRYGASPALKFLANPTFNISTTVLKYLSGIGYLTLGTKVVVYYTGDVGVFEKVYHSTAVSTITIPGCNNAIVNPSSVPNHNDTFAVTNELTLTVANVATNSPTVSVQLTRPEKNISAAVNLNKRICTYGIVSTDTVESFYDEDRRVVIDSLTKWDSISPLVNGNAQVNNGSLIYGNADYPAKSGPQEYQRHFVKASASTGSLTLNGIQYTDVSPYGTGNLNVLLQLDTDGKIFDLGRVVGDKNGDGSGTTRANSVGGRINGSGSQINWSIGTNSTAYNGSKYRVIVILRNSTLAITKITGA